MKNIRLTLVEISLIAWLVCVAPAQQKSDTTYTVRWTLVDIIMTECPDAGKVDEYGIGRNTVTGCAVLHTRVERTQKEKEFKTEKEADEFIKNMPTKRVWGLGSSCENAEKIVNIKKPIGATSN